MTDKQYRYKQRVTADVEFSFDEPLTEGQSPLDELGWWVTLDGEECKVASFMTSPPVALNTDSSFPKCERCGGQSWHLDADVRTRSAIIVGKDGGRVLVDRYGPDAALIDTADILTFECSACGLTAIDDVRKRVLEHAEALVKDNKSDWRIMTDYREM